MKIRILKFRAATADDAMEQVYRTLGDDAVVLEVKQVAAQGMFAWLSSRQEVVVKASRARPKKQDVAPQTAESTKASNLGTIAAAAASKRPESGNSQTQISFAVLQPTANEATAIQATNRFSVDETELPGTSVVVSGTGSPSLTTPASRTVRPIETAPEPFAPLSSEAWRQAAADVVREMSVSGGPARIAFNTDRDRNDSGISKIEQRLDTLQQMIADLGRKPLVRGFSEIPPDLFPHYLTLIEADVDDEIARELITKLQHHATPEQLSDTATSSALLTVLIEQKIHCAQSLVPRTGRRQIAMIVGPTGVGKTTTLAKLAGCHGVDRGLKIGLITVDTYRVAAVEQLRTYAEIIDIPMRVVNGRGQVQEALDSLADRDLVFIDTAGRSPHDDQRLEELKQLIDVTRPDHVYLILSLASGAKALRTTADRFASVGPTSAVFTKLDEAAGCGTLLAASRDIGLPISYLTTGQDVPLDIEPANPCRIARLIMGIDRIANSPSPVRSMRMNTR